MSIQMGKFTFTSLDTFSRVLMSNLCTDEQVTKEVFVRTRTYHFLCYKQTNKQNRKKKPSPLCH